MKVTVTEIDLEIRQLSSSNPVYLAHVHTDCHKTLVTVVISTPECNFTHCELLSARGDEHGPPQPWLHAPLRRQARAEGKEEVTGDDDEARPVDVVAASGLNVSSRAQTGGPLP